MKTDNQTALVNLRRKKCKFTMFSFFVGPGSPFTPDQATLLSFYIQRYVDLCQNSKLDRFFVTHTEIRTCLGDHYSDYAIQKHKEVFRAQGLMQTRMHNYGGRWNREWIALNFRKIEALFSETPSTKLSGHPQNFSPPCNTTYTTYTSCKNNTSYSSNTSDTPHTLISSSEIEQQDAVAIVEWWNSLSGVTKHTSPSTKTYQSAIQYLSHLLEGKPLANTKSGAPDKRFEAFCTRYGIRPTIAIKQWSSDALKAAISAVVQQWENKTKPVLPELLWVPITSRGGGYSALLIHANRPETSAVLKKTANALARALGDRVPAQKKMIWATRLAAFSVESEIAGEDLLAAAEWYSRNNDRSQPYTILVDSADEFCQKYTQLKRAMERTMTPVVSKLAEDPKTLIVSHFGTAEGGTFYRECFQPAVEFIGGDGAILAARLLEFHHKLRSIQKSCKTSGEGWSFRLPAARIIQYYLDWVGESTWITSKGLGMLDMNHAIFNNWLEQHARQNMDRSPITGEPFTRKAV